jgi:ribonuclease HI
VVHACGIDLGDVDRTTSRFAFKKFSISVDPKTEKPCDISVYTDGSKIDGRVGFGLVIYKGHEILEDISEPLDPDCTVYQAELWALNTAGRILAGLGLRDQKISIFSDSMSSLFSLARSEMRSFLVQDTCFKLNSLCRHNEVHVQWTRAHVGTSGNEKADRLAKLGAQTIGPTRYFQKRSLKSLKKLVKSFFDFLWSKRWINDPACRQTRYWYSWVRAKLSAEILLLSRTAAAQIIQFCTGFNNLNYHSWKKGEINTYLCRLCLEGIEECWHLATECPAIVELRHGAFGPFGPQKDWKLQDLLNFINSDEISGVLQTRSTSDDPYYLP